MTRRMLLALATVLALGFAWRWVALGRAVDANRRAISAAVRGAGGVTGDASSRVAIAVHENEARFDAMLHLAAARRVAGWLSLACAAVAVGLAARARVAPRRQPPS